MIWRYKEIQEMLSLWLRLCCRYDKCYVISLVSSAWGIATAIHRLWMAMAWMFTWLSKGVWEVVGISLQKLNYALHNLWSITCGTLLSRSLRAWNVTLLCLHNRSLIIWNNVLLYWCIVIICSIAVIVQLLIDFISADYW